MAIGQTISAQEFNNRYKAQTPKPAAKKSLFSKIGSVAKGIGSAITSSEQTFGKALSTVGSNVPTQVGNLNVESARDQQTLIDAIHKQTDPAKKAHLIRAMNLTYGQNFQAPTQTDINPAFGLSNKQVIGAAGGTALDIATAGTLAKGAKSFSLLKAAAPGAEAAANTYKALSTGQKLTKLAKSTAKASAVGGAIGYGYDVTQNLQANKGTGEAFKPGWGAALGIALPAAFGAYKAGKITANTLGARIDNSLIKPLAKDFRYGKNPGKTIAELGITANSQDQLVTNLRKAKQQVGAMLGDTAKTIQQTLSQQGSVKIDLKPSLEVLDTALKDAAVKNDSTLLQRLQNVKRALTHKLAPITDKEGLTGIVSTGSRNLNGGFQEALDIKRLVGDLTKWTGNPTEDKSVNVALKKLYSSIDEKLTSAAKSASPELSTRFDLLNKQYADLLTGEIAAKHTNELTQRHNLVSLPIKVGGAAGLITAIATGGAAIPAILATVGAGALDKALSSTAVKTRIAAFLSKEGPSALEKLITKNPAIKDVLYKTFYKENKSVDKAVLSKLQDFKKNGVPVGLSIKNTSPKTLQIQETMQRLQQQKLKLLNQGLSENSPAVKNIIKSMQQLSR